MVYKLTEQSVYFVTRLKGKRRLWRGGEANEIPQRRRVPWMKWSFFYKLAQAGQRPFSGGSGFTMRSTIACWYF